MRRPSTGAASISKGEVHGDAQTGLAVAGLTGTARGASCGTSHQPAPHRPYPVDHDESCWCRVAP
ncbi:hypothetical protein Krad_4528 (plasmid) [Kineococcus radiotolerans SRS30216 = ATCC BAA-149]|uniref:Uncharacterized protein n=1 Tax=Kineococcus radiotolerans (strain ATCC BAA-149 / DSM 14245 / SRS30216) TaxID=266940 RepID=A6WGP8_KINRD|nr:hypothetical protein Krad_4528 [Kineococcus radiotolerans SRS30216 = ATCC BAA-149]